MSTPPRPDPPESRLAALIATWRKEADIWQRGVGEDAWQVVTYRRCADELEAALSASPTQALASAGEPDKISMTGSAEPAGDAAVATGSALTDAPTTRTP